MCACGYVCVCARVRDISNIMLSIIQCGPHNLGASAVRAVDRLGIDATFHMFSLTENTVLHRLPCDSLLLTLF